jgi:hypothetical protein
MLALAKHKPGQIAAHDLGHGGNGKEQGNADEFHESVRNSASLGQAIKESEE